MVKKLFKGILKGTLKLMVLGMVFFVFCTISNNRAEKNMADALGIPESKINIKATTEEGLGFTGRGEGIASQAICLLIEKQD